MAQQWLLGHFPLTARRHWTPSFGLGQCPIALNASSASGSVHRGLLADLEAQSVFLRGEAESCGDPCWARLEETASDGTTAWFRETAAFFESLSHLEHPHLVRYLGVCRGPVRDLAGVLLEGSGEEKLVSLTEGLKGWSRLPGDWEDAAEGLQAAEEVTQQLMSALMPPGCAEVLAQQHVVTV
ncbi:unnamed protein product [Effrenium voratum]|nr:unnamed protein product [Effrenium voratum]